MERSLITLRGVLLVVAVLGAVLLVLKLWSTILMIVVALMFASALTPWVDRLQDSGLPRGLAALIIGLMGIALIAFFVLVLGPVLVDQARALVDDYPRLRAEVAGILRDHGAKRAAVQVERLNLQDLVPPETLARAGLSALGVVSTVASLGLLTFYALIDAHRLQRFVFYLLPEHSHTHARYLMRALQGVVGGYIRGQLITSLCIMAFTFVLLTVLRVPHALALAVLAFFGDMVPVIGVFVIIAPTALAALQQSVTAAVIVVVALTAYTQFENGFLVQRVYGTTLNLPSTAVLVGIMVGGALLGPVGALLSLPATATVAVLVRYWHDLQHGLDPTGHLPGTPTDAAPVGAGGAPPTAER
jgi:predicted PurR-regulated permease PerM